MKCFDTYTSKNRQAIYFCCLHCWFYCPVELLAVFELWGASVFFLSMDAMHFFTGFFLCISPSPETWNFQIFTLSVGILFCIERVKLTLCQSCRESDGVIWVTRKISSSHVHFFRYVLIWSLQSICVRLWAAS